MRKLVAFLAAGAFLLGSVGAAQAKLAALTGTLTLSLGTLPPIVTTGLTGFGIRVNGYAGTTDHLFTLRMSVPG